MCGDDVLAGDQILEIPRSELDPVKLEKLEKIFFQDGVSFRDPNSCSTLNIYQKGHIFLVTWVHLFGSATCQFVEWNLKNLKKYFFKFRVRTIFSIWI